MRPEAAPGSRPHGLAGAPTNEERIEILLIDDSADYLLLIQRALEHHDPRYRVTGVASPEEAYLVLDDRTFDLVLLDYKFPRGNGLQVVRTLKGKASFIPTVMVTAFGDEGLAIQVMREGALDFVPKTSDFIQALPEVVARSIERGRIIRERIRARELLERRNRELQALNAVAAAMTATQDPDQIVAVAVEALSGLLGSPQGRALLHDPPGKDEPLGVLRGGGSAAGPTLPRPTEVSVITDEVTGARRLVLPLVTQDDTLGSLTFDLPAGREVSAADRALAATLGQQVSAAVENARLNAALRATEQYLQDLVENAGDEVVTIGIDGRITTWNSGAEAIYGLSGPDTVGRGWEVLWPPERRGEVEELATRVLRGGETVRNHETVRVTRDGELVDILLTLSPLTGPDGAVRGLACLGKNITFRKQLQAQLVQSEKMAAVGQLISGVAHELNNPLTGVLGYAQLVSTVDTGEKLQGYLDRIASEAARCQKIVQNLLTFARKHEPRAVRLQLNDVVQETLELRSRELQAGGVALTCELATDLPTTLADRHQLQQVLVNLVTNALQAMAGTGRPARLVVRTRLDEHGLGGRPALVVGVQDSGPGIPPSLRKRVFDPFFTTKTAGEGTGLGLSLAYGIVQEHGGEIVVGDAPLGGASVEVRLPVMPVLSEASAVRRAEAEARAPRDLGPKRILVVDDQESIRDIFTDILSREGHAIETASDGRQALAKIQEGKSYDLIIVDLRMPDFDGDRLYREVCRRHPDLADRMLFSSGDVVSEDVRRLVETSGARFLAKPFGVEDVRSTVSSFFEEHA